MSDPGTTDVDDDPFAVSPWAVPLWALILANVAAAVWRIIYG